MSVGSSFGRCARSVLTLSIPLNIIFMKRHLIVILFWGINTIICSPPYLQAYHKISIDGLVIDKHTKEPLSFANIQVENTYRGTTSNLEGRF